MTIETLRRRIDAIDNNLIVLLSRRIRIAKKIGDLKKKKREKIINEKREKEIVARIKKQARKERLREKFAEELFKKIIKEARRVQR
jgi:chorismate mutase